MTSSSTHHYRTMIAAGSLVLGPLLMSVGDLIHPQEREDAAEQTAIVLEHVSRWYAAHLLLFIGALVFIPGILALARLAAEARSTAGYAGRILLLVGMGGLLAIFVFEMLIGRFIADGADVAAATALLETFRSGWVLGVMMVPAAAFFAGVAVITIALARSGGPYRWPAVVFGLGALLILVQIITSEVLLSQIGNVVILVASAAFAWQVVRGDQSTTAS